MCIEGHHGPWCQLCQPGWLERAGSPCERCPENQANDLQGLIVAGGVVFGCIVCCCVVALLRNATQSNQPVDESDEPWQPNGADKKPKAMNKGTILKLTMIFLQILGSMSEVFELEFPEVRD